HGGSGAALEGIRGAVSYGGVKMNVDTDTQYAVTPPIAAHMFRHYDGGVKGGGEGGGKKAYEPRAHGQSAQAGMGGPANAGLRGSPLRGHAARLTAAAAEVSESLGAAVVQERPAPRRLIVLANRLGRFGEGGEAAQEPMVRDVRPRDRAMPFPAIPAQRV